MKKIKNLQKARALFAVIILIILLTIGFLHRINNPELVAVETQSVSEFVKPVLVPSTNETDPIIEMEAENIPAEFLIKNFPFASQAPLGNWDKTHDEACEEASVILVNYYLSGKKLTNETMDKEILSMVDWEMKKWGVHKDLTVEETLEMAKSNFGLKGELKQSSNLSMIKKEIASGNPVIIPTAGRLLGNPNFRSPGPVYHMVVVIGYNEKEIIVQDVGTRNGNLYKYNSQIFLNAWHDWTGDPVKIESGEKNYLVLKR